MKTANNINLYKELWLPYPIPPHWWSSRGNFNEYTREECKQLADKHGAKNIKYLSQKGTEDIDWVFKRICHPSTGLICLKMATEEFPTDEICYTGFDNFSTGWYWDVKRDCTVNMKNSILFEKIFINKMKKECKITELA